MRKFFALILCLLLAFAATGCAEGKTILYADTDLGDYVKLANYKSFSVNLSSEEFTKYYEGEISRQLSEYNTLAKITEGYVEIGNTVNIDYIGKIDGKVYSGGNVTDFQFVVGKGEFDYLSGFEEAIVGKEIGEVVEIPLTFASDYKNENLAGKTADFIIKINYVMDEDPTAQEYYGILGYAGLKECERAVVEAAVKELLLDKVIEESEKDGYPEEMVEKLYNTERDLLDKAMLTQMGKDFSTYLATINQTEEDYKKNLIENKIKPSMDSQMVVYALLKDMGLSVTKDEITERAAKLAEDTAVVYDNTESILETYGEHYFEDLIATEKVKQGLFEKVKFDKASIDFIDGYLN